MSYEETALRGELTEEQIENLLDSFAQGGSIDAVSKRVDLPKNLVRELLDEPDIARRAMTRKKALMGVLLPAEIIDTLRANLTGGTPQSQVSAASKLIDILGLTPEKPKKAPKRRKSDTGGALEAALD